MKNEHGLICPVDWEKQPSHCNWIAVDENGDCYAYENKPEILPEYRWLAVDDVFWFLCEVDPPEDLEPPADFTLCLWKRPK